MSTSMVVSLLRRASFYLLYALSDPGSPHWACPGTEWHVKIIVLVVLRLQRISYFWVFFLRRVLHLRPRYLFIYVSRGLRCPGCLDLPGSSVVGSWSHTPRCQHLRSFYFPSDGRFGSTALRALGSSSSSSSSSSSTFLSMELPARLATTTVRTMICLQGVP